MKKVHLRSFPSVQLAVHGLGRYRVITTVEQAAETLLERWPVQEGEAFRHAVQSCLDAIEGKADPATVRDALITAAAEADIDVRR